MRYDLKQAGEILEEYSKPNSMVDNGNLFFAGIEYQKAYRDLKQSVGELFNVIRHGDEKHQTWLKEAIETHFSSSAASGKKGEG
jgi:hypothetical protein